MGVAEPKITATHRRLLDRMCAVEAGEAVAVKSGVEWWALKSLIRQNLAVVTGLAGRHRAPKVFVRATLAGRLAHADATPRK